MPSDYSVHAIGDQLLPGHMVPAPVLPALAQDIDLAEDTASDPITLTAPGVLCIVADAKLRLDIASTALALNPAASGIVLPTGTPRFFTLTPGTWYIETTAA